MHNNTEKGIDEESKGSFQIFISNYNKKWAIYLTAWGINHFFISS